MENKRIKLKYDENRYSYRAENGDYIYEMDVKMPDGKWKRIKEIIPCNDETRESIEMLNQDDHDFALQNRYQDEWADYRMRNRREKACREGKADPFEQIANMVRAAETTGSGKITMEKVEKFLEEELHEEQRELFYARVGERKKLEDIRREWEKRTGKTVSKQAFHRRWDRILTKFCKYFDIEKPKQEHKRLNRTQDTYSN